MIRLYGYDTVNTLKILIALEETGTAYRLVKTDTDAGDQRKPDFLALNPNGKVPVIADEAAKGGPLVISESGAILIYLAEKTGFGLPDDAQARVRTLEWLAYQLSTQGPIFGQCEYWTHLAPEGNASALEHYLSVARKILTQMDRHLSAAAYFAGADYSIADIAHFSWMTRTGHLGLSLDGCPALAAWFDTIAERPGVLAARAKAAHLRTH